MTNHYYNNNLETKSMEKIINCHIFNHELKFITDHGVFSRTSVDYGSLVLIKNSIIEPWYKRILDVGCGYGVIGISLAKKYPEIDFDLIDVNLRALNLTKSNIIINNVKNVRVFESNIYEMINNKYDCILSNPPIRAGKKVVHAILEKSVDFLTDSGAITVVIQKKQGAQSAVKKLNLIFGNCEIISRDKGYYLLRSVKMPK